MRIATWNVNSIRTRVDRVVDWLQRQDIDVLAMQEIKCKPEQFPRAQFEDAGYEVIAHGLNQWNGVAFASRYPIGDVATEFPGMPGFNKGEWGPDVVKEARALGVTVEDVRLWSLYVPNGRELDNPHYAYKLAWLSALRDAASGWQAANPAQPLAMMGDWNIAPLDSDVWSMEFFEGRTHVSAPERKAFNAFTSAGFTDVVRPLAPTGYTYWDYQQLRFPKNEGMRIDFILGNSAFANEISGAEIDRNERKGKQPSDHVPVVVDFAADDDAPMVF